MSERGYICLDRGALNHEFFRRDEHSEFEAWVWLLTEAAWKPRVRRIGEFMVALQRGQLVASIRHLVDVWAWSKGKVERFIARLKNEAMIGTHIETGITVITVCNYERYQTKQNEAGTDNETANGTVVGHPRGQSWDTHGDNTEEINHSTIEAVNSGAEVAPAKKSRRRQSARTEVSLPSDFSFDEQNAKIAEGHGFIGASASRLFDKFCSSAKAKGRKYVDWRAAWRVWCNNQAQWDAERLSQIPQARRIPKI